MRRTRRGVGSYARGGWGAGGAERVAVSNLMRLLDLPDDVLELLERGALSEGHGRALLLADDHGKRRTLAATAVSEGWSVRVTEDKARAANRGTDSRITSGRTAARTAHPDQEQAASDIADALGAALGADVRVRAIREGGYRAEIRFSSPEEALELAKRVLSGASPDSPVTTPATGAGT